MILSPNVQLIARRHNFTTINQVTTKRGLFGALFWRRIFGPAVLAIKILMLLHNNSLTKSKMVFQLKARCSKKYKLSLK